MSAEDPDMSISHSRGAQAGGGNNIQNNYVGDEGPVAHEVLLRHARELVPVRLEGRGSELAPLAAFCRGDKPYMRWEAGPWAGKTALLAAFVLDPPDDVDVLHFFVRAGEAYWNDSCAFVASLYAQLVVHLGVLTSGTREPGLLRNEFTTMLDTAAAGAETAGRRLALVVDGIDEDQSRNRTPVLPSIVSLLPRVAHRALRVVMAGRKQLDQATDLTDEDHPALIGDGWPLTASASAPRCGARPGWRSTS